MREPGEAGTEKTLKCMQLKFEIYVADGMIRRLSTELKQNMGKGVN